MARRKQTPLEVTSALHDGEKPIPWGNHEGSGNGTEDLVCGSCGQVVLGNASLAEAYANAATNFGRLVFECECGKYNVIPCRSIGPSGIV